MLYARLYRLIKLYKRYGNGLAGFVIFLWKVFGIHVLYKEKNISWSSKIKWIVHRDFQSSKNPWYYGISEKTEFEFLTQNIKTGDVFYDIGANVGLYSIWMAAFHPVQCYLFEPDPKHQDFILRLIHLNQLETQCILQSYALGEENGFRYLTIGHDMNNKVSVQNTNLPIAMRRLDDLTELPKPSILKIDTEGYELKILQAGLQTLKSEMLRIIIIEKSETLFEECHKIIISYGFKPLTTSSKCSHTKEEFPTTQSGNLIYIKM